MKEVKQLVQLVAKKFNLSTTKEDAISKGDTKYLFADLATCYGGYRLNMVNVETGGRYGAFNESSCCKRRTKKQMVSYLTSLINS
jgi:hypothetical protein